MSWLYPYVELAGELSLELIVEHGIVPSCRLLGELDGQPVVVAGSMERTTVTAPIEPALDLGLRVQTIPLLRSTPLTRERVMLGLDDWDREIQAFADENARARVLFGGPLRDAILELNAEGPSFVLEDGSVRSDVAPGSARSVALVANVARSAKVARRDVPCAAELAAHEEVWKALAEEHGLDLESTPLRAEGAVRTVAWSARSWRVGLGTHRISLSAHWTALIAPAGLSIRRETTMDRLKALLGVKDVCSGDAEFDRTFYVRADNPDWAKRALDTDARRALLDAATKFEDVHASDEGLIVEGDAGRVAPSDASLVAGWAEFIGERLARTGEPAGGPYR